jgi:hypothetical protein
MGRRASHEDDASARIQAAGQSRGARCHHHVDLFRCPGTDHRLPTRRHIADLGWDEFHRRDPISVWGTGRVAEAFAHADIAAFPR